MSSVTLLRRLGNHSRKNRLYRAFRELGRAIRTITLLRYLMRSTGPAYGKLGAWWPPAGEHFCSQGLESYRKIVPLPAAGRVDRCWDVVRADGVSTVSLGR